MNCRRVPVAFITCGSNRQGCLGFRASYQSSFKFEPSIVAVISAVGGLDLEEWALLRRVLGLIKECAPRHSGNAHGRLGTIRLCAVQACHVRRQRWRVAFSFHVRQSGGGTMSHWNLKRAARLGYLAGRGLSVGSIMADHVIAARSERAVRCAASRWGLALGIGSPSASFCRWQDRLALAHRTTWW